MANANMIVVPKAIKVLYSEYTVAEEPNLHDGEADLYGHIEYLNEIIILNSNASEEQKKATLLHECIHALDEAFDIGLEEQHVKKLGNGLYMLLKDNPELMYMMHHEEPYIEKVDRR